MPASLQSLRQLLATRFPAAGAPAAAAAVLATGLPSLDEAIGGGVPRGALTEIVCAAPSCGGQLLLLQLLAAARAACARAALVDAGDTFDPAGAPAELLPHLVWVRAPVDDATAALAAADLLARDANLGLVALDLRALPAATLRRFPATAWYRLQRAVEPAALALVVFTPAALVPSAALRLALGVPHTAAALGVPRPQLAAALAPALERRRPQSLALSA